MIVAVLNSGSNGNCCYVSDGTDAILVDAGLSCKQIEYRMMQLGLRPETVRGVFVSHEHSDHIFGLKGLYKKHRIPIYMTDATREAAGLPLPSEAYRSIGTRSRVDIGGLSIEVFPVSHDAADPHQFTVSTDSVRFGVFTDLGYPSEQVKGIFRTCDAVVLETNYDEDMLDNGPYPLALRQRISGQHGHLSNRQAFELFQEHRNPQLSHVFLGHLSQENNSPDKVMHLFGPQAGRTRLVMTSRHGATPVYRIGRQAAQLFLFDP